MTEIQWLVDIMLSHKLPGPVKDKFIARIGEVEAQLAKAQAPQIQRPPPQAIIPSVRMPATESMMEIPAGVMKPPATDIDKETGRPVISTGNGTRGPRKF